MTDQSRIKFSNKLAEALISQEPLGLAQFLARSESEYPAHIPCPHCPYLSKSHQEGSLHARLHRD